MSLECVCVCVCMMCHNIFYLIFLKLQDDWLYYLKMGLCVMSFKQFEGILLHRNKKHTDVWGSRDSLAIKLIYFLRTLIFISSELVSKVYIKYAAYRRYKFSCVYMCVFSPESPLIFILFFSKA